ncbi:2-hydroxyacyl-CoA dehydratase [Collinsella sp. AGMB00827]|uniref:2-hydroxyacyl-CoA dehydratase n=1 Tax=Collinsella ureilytica TaxID=2869515 RepID=A0ABS7MLH4_9ACTN|nr:2-hydroxyacyl-CoA dehydratase [Collinsella urealyticum]MBY4798209.1 2-hydroxyacyl-CoA dehydratase [Collinsella urealyticum]
MAENNLHVPAGALWFAERAIGPLQLGIDVGSTTVKLAVLNEAHEIVYAMYQRHHTDVRACARDLFEGAAAVLPDAKMTCAITGSGGMLLSQWLGLEFVQEVIASKRAVETMIPKTDVAIELGGEDAKIIYFDSGIEQRMNGTCAGGTGAFIDQMAVLLKTDAAGLNELARGASTIYPIASRCGVFAKTDVQPLLNEGAHPEDIAASIFQAVVTQTISGLACGRPIRGHIAFLGGPLQYLSELRRRFYLTLELDEEHRIVPENAHLFVASGAAMAHESEATTTFAGLIAAIDELGDTQGSEVARLEPLFEHEEAYRRFKDRHDREVVPTEALSAYTGSRVFIGLDAGSTTMKAAMVGEDGQLLHTWYGSNHGDILGTAKTIMADFYEHLPQGATIGHVTTTGYGEALLIEALKADSGEIETVAHLRGAKAFLPGVEFILDIGGQDMKCLRVRDGVIEHIMLNEACSSGCGSFIESFAVSMNMDVEAFAEAAIGAEAPVDLGSRCTVFMNSRVKQAQKEGATVGDIAAGLSYSVIKNALFKVIKLRDPKEIGTQVIVQGGTFMSDATLRAFELLTGVDAVRPDIAGCMGAYGAALLARDRAGKDGISGVLAAEEIAELTVRQRHARCGLCSNNCQLTINDFGGGRRFITGNRCERGAGGKRKKTAAPNLFSQKNRLLFDRPSLTQEEAIRGSVGIPRALNIYENYPFWHTFFTRLGFRVILSDDSNKKIYNAGIESMPSESACYPAKLSHGHIMNLIEKDPDFIWMPCVRWERKEDETAGNCYNCPIVMSYPTALALNIDELAEDGVEFLYPFIPYHDKIALKRRLYEILVLDRERDAEAGRGRVAGPRITRSEIDAAVNAAYEEDAAFHARVQIMGEQAMTWIEDNGGHGIVLAGRPYHNDPEINHALPELISSFGFAVLTEDSVAHLVKPERPIRVVDQWMYHSRLYAAARLVTMRNDLDLIQMNSFGCGLDALTTDQVQEILEVSGKIYTVLKIDEVSNLGAARIRVRSLMAALQDREAERAREAAKRGETYASGAALPVEASADAPAFSTRVFNLEPQRAGKSAEWPKVPFTEKMRDEGYTILCPQMAPIHFDLIKEVMIAAGYNFELLPSTDRGAVEAGLRYVNNDICYPSILVTGQIMEAIESGRYDLSRTAVIISQTGGGCRATNYIALIRKALREAGHPEIPVISLAAVKLDEENPGFKLKPSMLKAAVYCVIFGDLMMQMLYRCRPYEKTPGAANALFESFMARARALAPQFTRRSFTKLAREAIAAFDTMPLVGEGTKPRVGVVGEILVKFHPTANNHVVEVIEDEGCEAVVPGLLDFFLYSMSNARLQQDELGSSAVSRTLMDGVIGLVDWMRRPVDELLEKSARFERPKPISVLAEKASQVLSLCNNMGEGWLLTAEMLDLIDHGAPNIICTQPFACLPNHVVGKAVIKQLRRMHPESNIVAVDYDPGASEANQLNRIKLMISVAKENLRAGKGFHMEGIRPLALDEVDAHFRPDTGSGGCGGGCAAFSEEAIAATAQRLSRGIKR